MGINVGDLFFDLKLNTKQFESQIHSMGNYAQKSINKSFGGIGKFIATALSTAAIGSFAKSCLDLGSALSEVQNVVDVVFPTMNSQVDAFAKNAINQFGLSETVAKRMTGTYGSMARAFGFSEKEAYNMSTALTGLAGDVASFYNMDPTEAYTKLKSVFSGETETLKDLGVVMTQSALDQYALANGFGRATSEMTEQEKVALRLQFVTTQLSAAGGDFARTSDSWANKVRVLSLNFQTLKATLGQGFIQVLSPVISMLNNLVLKLQKAAQYFVAFVNLITGNKKTSTSLGNTSQSVEKISSGLGGASTGASKLANNIGGVGKSAKKAAKQMGALASFDDIKNISSKKDTGGASGGSSGGAGGTGGIGGDLGGATNTVAKIDVDTSGMEKGINKMREMWTKFTTFLGNHKEIILSIIAGIMAGFLTFETIKWWGTLSTGVMSVTTYLSNMFKVLSVGMPGLQALVFEFTGLGATAAGVVVGITAIVTALTYLYQTNESFRKMVETSVLQALVFEFTGLGATAAGVVVGITAIVTALTYLYQTNESFRKMVETSVKSLSTILNNLYKSVLQPLFGFLSSVFQTILVPIATFLAKVFTKAVESVSKVLMTIWNSILAPLANFLVDILGIALQGVIDIWEAWKPKIDSLFNCLMWIWDEALAPIADFITTTFCKYFEEWGALIQELIPSVEEIFKGLVTFFTGIFTGDMSKAWEGIEGIFSGFGNFLGTVFTTDWTKKLGALGVPLNILCSTIKTIWSTIKGVFGGIIDFVSGVFTGNWKKAWQGVKSVFSSIVSGLANIFKRPINTIIGGINSFIDGINKIKIPDWVPGVGGYGFHISKIPKLAQGGYVKANTPRLAMIGDNKRHGEIVSPENKMYEVMMDALKAYGQQQNGSQDMQVVVSIMYEIIDAIKQIRLVVDGDSLNEDNNHRDIERSLRTGKLIMG